LVVAGGKGGVALGVPVLRHDDVLEGARQLVDDGHDFGAFADGQRAAVNKTVLHVDHDQGGAAGRFDLCSGKDIADQAQAQTANETGAGGFQKGSAVCGLHGDTPMWVEKDGH
jgi:hypothetical protein